MALKACRECKKDISTDAKVCPSCGKKSPHGASNIVKYGGGFLAVMFGLPVMVGFCGALARGGSSASSGTAHAAEQAALPVPPIEIDARNLWAAYNANEVAADNAYKGRVLAVTGEVSSIDKDMFDDVVLKLDTGKMFNDVHATLEKSEAGAAAALRKGTRVMVICKGKGMVMRSPMLEDCVFAR